MNFDYQFILIVNPNFINQIDSSLVQNYGKLDYVLGKVIRTIGDWDDDFAVEPFYSSCIQLIEFYVCDKSGQTITDEIHTIPDYSDNIEIGSNPTWIPDFLGHSFPLKESTELRIYSMNGNNVDKEYYVYTAIVMAYSEPQARLIMSERFPSGLAVNYSLEKTKEPTLYWFHQKQTTFQHIGTALDSMSPGMFSFESIPQYV